MMKKLFTFLLLLIGAVQDIYAQEPYAALNADNLTQTFYYDDNKDAKGGMNVGLFTYNWSSGVNSDWYDQCESITSVLFDETFADYKDLTSTVCWFYSCKNLATIIGIENLNTDNVTDISYMFYDCSGLTSLDVRKFNMLNVTNMYCMFEWCSELKTIYAENDWNTENVENSNYIFASCSKLVGGNGQSITALAMATRMPVLTVVSHHRGISLFQI